MREWFFCNSGGQHEGTLIVCRLSLPRCVRDCSGNSWRSVSQCRALVPRGGTNLRARVNWMTRASTFHAVRVQQVVEEVLGEGCIFCFSVLFSTQYVRALVCFVLSFGTFDFGRRGAREVGEVWRGRRTRIFASVQSRTKFSKRRAVLIRLAIRMVVWDRVVLTILTCLRSDAKLTQNSTTFCQVVFARLPKHHFVQQFRHVVFVSVGRKNCLLGLSSMCYSFLSLFRSVLVLIHSVQFI